MCNENIHCGHRARMCKKISENVNGLADHELLEAFLYNVIPRADTNATAHALLRKFGSLGKVFSAGTEELASVDGIGAKAAAYIVAQGEILRRIEKSRAEEKSAPEKWSTPEKVKAYLSGYFKDFEREGLLIVLLDKKFAVLNKIEYESDSFHAIQANIGDFQAAVCALRPKYVIIAHNHPSNLTNPSLQDDVTTGKLLTLCETFGVELLDHLIVCKDEIYSYRNDLSERFEILKRTCDFNKIAKNIEENMKDDK